MDRLSSKGQMIDQINIGSPNKSGFDMAFDNLGTGTLGTIIPTRVMELMPGDRLKGKSTAVLNFEPLAVPILANMYVKQESFVVPYRLVWKNFERFISGKKDFSTPPPFTNLAHVYTAAFRDPHLIYACIAPYGVRGLSLDDNEFGQYNRWVLPTNQVIGSLGLVDLVKPYFDRLDGFYKELKNLYLSYGFNFSDKLSAVCDSWSSWSSDLKTAAGFDNNSTVEDWFNGVKWFAQATIDSEDEENAWKFSCQILVDLIYHYVYYIGVGTTNNAMSVKSIITDIVAWQKNLFRFVSMYFAGPSSMLDYMHAPCVKPDYVERVLKEQFKGLDAWLENFTNASAGFSAITSELLAIEHNPLWDFPAFTNKGQFSYSPGIAQSITLMFVNGLSSISFNWLPFRAAYMVWYWNYRDQLLEIDAPDPEDFVGDTVASNEYYFMLLLRHRCWSKDTFTTALTNTGSGNVVVPTSLVDSIQNAKKLILADESADGAVADKQNQTLYKFDFAGSHYMLPSRFLEAFSEGKSDISLAKNALSLDNLNRAQRMARWLQKRLILGWEYADILYSSFMVKSSDARLQLPEIIDSSRSLVKVDTVVNNTTTEQQIAGDKTAIAYGVDNSSGFNYFNEEHSLLLSFMTVMPQQSYAHGVDRLYYRKNKFDYPWPEFAQLGMDAVYVGELTSPCAMSVEDEASKRVFGYQGRYYDMKSKQDEEHGRLLKDLQYFTFSRHFDLSDEKSVPKLNYQFVHCFPRLDMFVLDDASEDCFRYDVRHSLAVERCLPVASTEIA